jgi:uncharacterized Fe-S cluster-containing radical SAM superfamily enzyme
VLIAVTHILPLQYPDDTCMILENTEVDMAKDLTITMPDKYRERLEAEVVATGRSRSEIVRRALDAYWEKKGE